MMNDKSEPSGSDKEPNPEPPSSTGGRPEEADRQAGEGWFDRLRAAVGLKSLSFRRELEEALESEELDGAFSPGERRLLNNILRLREVRVGDIMIPRADVEAIEIDQSLAELIGRFRESGHSRMPVYRETLDEPVGMVHIKDLIRHMAHSGNGEAGSEQKDARKIDLSKLDLRITIATAGLVRNVLFVPPSMPVATLLAMMQSSRTQMALVIDEYGGTDGLVSIEDTVETIVGEIEDEYDQDEPEIIAQADGGFVADARASLAEVAVAIGSTLAADDGSDVANTIGGLVFRRLGHIPTKGETVTLPEGYVIEVLDADPRRIRLLKISASPHADSASDDKSTVDSLPRAASGA